MAVKSLAEDIGARVGLLPVAIEPRPAGRGGFVQEDRSQTRQTRDVREAPGEAFPEPGVGWPG